MGDFPQVSHVIFDFDGLLVETESAYTKANTQLLSKFGKQVGLQKIFPWVFSNNEIWFDLENKNNIETCFHFLKLNFSVHDGNQAQTDGHEARGGSQVAH